MPSFFETIKKGIHKNQELFTALEEFDRTGKLRKIMYKERVNFTIDEGLINEFRSYCKKNNLKMSAVIESLVRKEINK